jgi:PAS domain S-box-containing protein
MPATSQNLAALNRVLNSCFEAVISVNTDGRIVFFNAAAERLFGYTAEEVVDRHLDLLLPERYRGRHIAFIEAFRASGEDSRLMGRNGEICARRKDGSEFFAEGSISKVPLGDRMTFTTVLRDVSERHRSEQRLRASEEKYRAIVDSAPDAILVASAESGLIREANLAAGEMFGCAADDLIGVHQEELHPQETREIYRKYFREHLEDGRIKVPDGVIARSDGGEMAVSITARPTQIAGEPVLVGFFRDIRDRKCWEAELAQARDDAQAANRAKSEFLASMSHELRTPLNGILGFAEMIEGERLGPLGNRTYVEYAGHIRQSGRYLLQTIEEILDYSRLEAGKFQLHEVSFSVAECVAECLRMIGHVAEHNGIAFEIGDFEGLPALRGDPHAFKQVLMNLLSNAVKFTPEGGRVSIAARLVAGDGLEVEVADTGIGIPPEHQGRVFERFEQGDNALLASKKGTGIGLALARALMQLHGGSLNLTSEVGRGTSVTARFPGERVLQQRVA